MTPEELKDFTILARLIEYQYRIAAFTDEALISILRAVDIARRDTIDEVESKPMWAEIKREDLLLNELEALTEVFQNEIATRINEAAVTSGQYSVPAYNNILSFDGAVVGFSTVALSQDQIQVLASAPVKNRYLKEWVTVSVRDQLNAGVLRGEPTRKLVDRVRDAWDGIEHDMISLTRTYVAEMNNQAAQAVYQANDDIIQYEEWNATLEVAFKGHGTCLRCAGLDGRRFRVGQGVRPPLHLRCRCFMLPVTATYKELGLDIPEIEKVARPYTLREGKFPINVGGTRKIIEAGQFQGDFKKFLMSQSRAYQKDLLGPGRLGLLDAGKITWGNLVDKNGNLRLLKELR